jgi:hypothetical protein
MGEGCISSRILYLAKNTQTTKLSIDLWNI